MRRLVFIAILLVCSINPIVENGSAEKQGNQSGLEVIAQTDYIIHLGETIEASITVRNLEQDATEIEFDYHLPNEISIANLPNEFYLESNQIRQFRFYFTCSEFADYKPVIANVNITEKSNPGVVYSNDFTLVISKESDLRYGVDDNSEFVVDPGIRTNLAVNITNFGMFDDEVSFSVVTNSNWGWGWDMALVEDGKALESLLTGELKFIRMWIDIPKVIDSSPLYLTGPTFSLLATSSLDSRTVSWSFSLLMSEFSNVTLDSSDDFLSLDPDSNDRIPITVRNSGNVENLLSLELQIIDDLGNTLSEPSETDRIIYDGWIIAIFGGYEDETVQPAESRTFEIGFQSPNENSGELRVRVKVIPSGANNRAINVDLTSVVSWNRELATELISSDCEILPSQSCNPKFRIYNNGNFADQVTLTPTRVPEFVNLDFNLTSLEIAKNSFVDIDDLVVTAEQEVAAFTFDQIIIQISLLNSEEEAKTIVIDVVIEAMNEWSKQGLVTETDSLGRFNIAMTLRNDGNAEDGIIVQLQCSHYTTMTLIPPTDSITEEDVAFPRSFVINGIEFGDNFTIRAWAEIPKQQTSNGTMYLNITIRSNLAPDEPISFATSVDYLGSSWQINDDDSSKSDLAKNVAYAFSILNSWKWIIISIMVSCVIVGKAYRDRKYRLQNTIDWHQEANRTESKPVDDWMAKFSREERPTVEDSAPQIPAEQFKLGFKQKSPGVKPVATPVDERLRDAAALVLDTHDKTNVIEEADTLLESINVDGINSIPQENTKLTSQDYVPSRTNRNDPQMLLNNATKSEDHVKSVPLPDEPNAVDDLDF